MTLNWDFTNYTFSFLVSLVGSILGICYPLFLESIRKIDDQYESTVLAAHFQKEPVFKLYKTVLLFAIIVSFIAPFVMLLSDNYLLNIAVETLHCIFVLALVFVMLYMFNTIQTYYNPKDLAGKLFDDFDPRNPVRDPELLICALDMMRYTSKRPNTDVYTKCKSYICNVAYSEQKSSEGNVYNLSHELQNTLLKATDYATDNQVRPLCYDNLVAQLLLHIYVKFIQGEQNYSVMWRALFRIMESENTEWFESYWSSAVQHYSFVVNNIPGTRDEKNEAYKSLQRFKEQHHALGAMLVYNKKYDWLHFILTHDHVSPPKFELVPSTFGEIIDFLSSMTKQLERPWTITAKYQMKGMFNDINSDYRIVEQMYRYCALLTVRLFSFNDYNIRYEYPMSKPYIEEWSLNDLKVLKTIIERLNNEISAYWYANNLIEEIHLPLHPTEAEVLSLTNDFIKDINDKIQYQIENPELDKEKFDELKTLLVELDNKATPLTLTPSDEERASWKKSEIQITVEQQLDENICSKNGYMGWSNYPEVLLHCLQMKIEGYIDGSYSFLNPKADLIVSERHVFDAFKKLAISNGYTILSMGVYLGGIDVKYNTTSQIVYNVQTKEAHYGNIPVIERNSAMSAIYVIKTSEMLKLETTAAPDERFAKRNMTLLESSANNLYTNIDEITAGADVRPIIKIGKNVSLYSNTDASFIRIRVQQSCDDTVELARMQKLEEYLN